MKHLVWTWTLLLSCAAGSIVIAQEPVPMCPQGQLYIGAGGDGWTTTIVPFDPVMFPGETGEQIGEFSLLLLGANQDDCPGKSGRHGGSSQLQHWHGIVRGQLDEAGLRHALVNLEGGGHLITSDVLVEAPIGACAVGYEPGVLVREELTVVEGTWDGQTITAGMILAHVCLPIEISEGSRVDFEVVEGTYLCRLPPAAEP